MCPLGKKRNPARPQAAFAGESFRIGGGGIVPAEGIAATIGTARAWGLNIDVPDPNVLGRIWNTEITVTESPSGARFSAVLRNISSRDEDLPFDRTVPGIVRQLIGKLDVSRDARQVSPVAGRVLVHDRRLLQGSVGVQRRGPALPAGVSPQQRRPLRHASASAALLQSKHAGDAQSIGELEAELAR